MFRFTIRELVLLTVIVAMGVGWWLDHRRLLAIVAATEIRVVEVKRLAQLLMSEEKELLQAIEESGHTVVYGLLRRPEVVKNSPLP